MTYRVLLVAVLVLWPGLIAGLLMLMSKLENYLERIDAASPEEAGLEPVEGGGSEREVKIVFGDSVVREPES